MNEEKNYIKKNGVCDNCHKTGLVFFAKFFLCETKRHVLLRGSRWRISTDYNVIDTGSAHICRDCAKKPMSKTRKIGLYILSSFLLLCILGVILAYTLYYAFIFMALLSGIGIIVTFIIYIKTYIQKNKYIEHNIDKIAIKCKKDNFMSGPFYKFITRPEYYRIFD